MALKGFARAIVVITAISAAIMELIDTSIVNVALAQISGNLGATIEDTSWVITAYAIANVIIIPMTGFLQRYFGRKNYYITSIIIFTIASWLCGQSSSLVELVVWRFVQGVGGGALLSTSQGIMFDAFPPEKRGAASALFGMGIILGPTIGPILGGYIVENYQHWGLIFDINIPFGIVATILAWRFVEKKPDEFNIDRKSIPIDLIGIVLLATGIGSLQYALERGESEDWFDSAVIVWTTLAAIVGIGGFIWRQLVIDHPILNLRVLKNRNLLASNVMMFVVGFGLFGTVYIFPVMAQRILGFTPLEAGLGLIPGAIAAIAIMPVIGAMLGKGVRPLVFVILGFIFFILHGVLSSFANADSSRAWFIIPQVVRGLGTAMLTIPLTSQAVAGLKPKDMPYGIALNNMLRQLGGAFGIAVMNTYVAQRYAVHRYDLVSNLNVGDPLMVERLQQYKAGAMSRGVTQGVAENLSVKLLDLTVTKQAYLHSYLDAFILISIFFVCAIPFMFLLSNKKQDAAAKAAVAESAH